MTIEERIRQEVENWSKIGHPALMQRFLLRNGSAFEAQPFQGRRGKRGECFRNAYNAIGSGTYCEGYGWRNGLPILIHHAWRVDGNQAIDSTWDRPEECQYWGICFTDADLFEEVQKHRVYGMFDTSAGLNIDLMLRIDPGLREFIPAGIRG